MDRKVCLWDLSAFFWTRRLVFNIHGFSFER